MNLRAVLEQVPAPRGKQGQDYRLWSILSLNRAGDPPDLRCVAWNSSGK
jgi:hypothetical protein